MEYAAFAGHPATGLFARVGRNESEVDLLERFATKQRAVLAAAYRADMARPRGARHLMG